MCVSPQHRLVVPKAGKVSDLCSTLSQMTNVPANHVSSGPGIEELNNPTAYSPSVTNTKHPSLFLCVCVF